MSRLALAIAAAAFLGACSPRIEVPPASDTLPEVNDANCRPEAIQVLPKRIRQEFASRCFRAGTFTPSPPRYW
jgi:entry exclusion lipoprotein TrbK